MKRRASRTAVVEALTKLPPPVAASEQPELVLDFKGSPRSSPRPAAEPRDGSIKESIIRWLEQQL